MQTTLMMSGDIAIGRTIQRAEVFSFLFFLSLAWRSRARMNDFVIILIFLGGFFNFLSFFSFLF